MWTGRYTISVDMEKVDMDVVLKVLEVIVEKKAASMVDVAYAVRSFDTAHRYVKALVKMGLVSREKRGRRIVLEPTSSGLEVYKLLKLARSLLGPPTFALTAAPTTA